MAPRPGWARGHVTYVRFVMRNASKQNQGFGITQTEKPVSTATRIVLVNLAARSLQQLEIRRRSRAYLSPRRGCSSALRRAIELLGSSWFGRVPLSVTPSTTEGLVSIATRIVLVNLAALAIDNSGSVLSFEYSPFPTSRVYVSAQGGD